MAESLSFDGRWRVADSGKFLWRDQVKDNHVLEPGKRRRRARQID